MSIKTLLVWFLALCVPAFAAVDFTKPIQDIRFDGLSQKAFIKGVTLNSEVGRKPVESDLVGDVNALYLTGYFHKVEAMTEPADGQVHLVFKVAENPVIKKMTLKGNGIYSIDSLKVAMTNRVGEVFNTRFLQQDQKNIETYYISRGYDFFKILRVILEPSGELAFTLSEGQVEDVVFEGLERLPPQVVVRELGLQKGEPFNSNELRKDRERLLRLGYFSDVSAPQIQSGADPGKIKITYAVREKKINRLDLGLENERERILGFVKNDTSHILIPTDLISGKIQMGYAADRGFDSRSFSLRYGQPWLMNKIPLSFDADIWNEERNERLSDRTIRALYTNRRQGESIQLGLPVVRDYLTFSTRAKVESVSLISAPPAGRTVTPYSIRSLAAILNFSSVSSVFNPHSGTIWRVEAEKGNNLGVIAVGGLEFYRISGDFATFLGFGDNTVLGLHTGVGFFQTATTDQLTFESEGFEVGGFSSLRGYKESNPFLGFRKILLNIELRQDFNNTIQGVLFYDMGKAFDGAISFQPATFNTGVGAGVRFFTPVGPIRLDFAWPQARFTNFNDLIVHFSLGQMF